MGKRHVDEPRMLTGETGGCVGDRWTEDLWHQHHRHLGILKDDTPRPAPCHAPAELRSCPTPPIDGGPAHGRIDTDMPRMYCDAHWIAHLQQEEDWLDRYGPVPWAWDKTLNDEVFHPDAVPHRARKASRAGMVVALLAVAAALLVGGILIVSAMAENPLVH